MRTSVNFARTGLSKTSTRLLRDLSEYKWYRRRQHAWCRGHYPLRSVEIMLSRHERVCCNELRSQRPMLLQNALLELQGEMTDCFLDTPLCMKSISVGAAQYDGSLTV